MKPYVIIFNLIFISVLSNAAEYDFFVKSIVEPSVFSGSSNNTISPLLFVTLEQNWQSNDKKHKFTGQLNFQNISYNIKDISYEHNEIFPGEFLYEWAPSNHRVTIGYQYLRFIDGFDTVGMDSLNPEDQRASIFSENYIRYRSVPALNYKVIFDSFSLQMFNVFQPKANVANEYLLNKFKSSVNLSFIEDTEASKFFKRNDTGVRLLGSADVFDWSVYGLHVYDKSPLYEYNHSQLTLTQVQISYKSYGSNLTFDLSDQIIRFDFKYNDKRSFLNQSFEVEKSNEVLINLAFEPTEIFGMQWVFNYSHSEVAGNIDLLLRKKKIQDFYIQLSKKINDRLNFSSLYIQRISDSGSAAQFEIENNLSKSIDIRFGVEYFHKKDNTTFAELSDLSRIYLGFNAYTSN